MPTPTPQPPAQITRCGIPEARVTYCTPEPPDGSVVCPTPRIAFTLSLGMGPRSTPPPPTPSAREGIGTVTVDRTDVTAQGRPLVAASAPPAAYLWEYRPLRPLTPGRHEVVVTYGDAAGVARSHRWAFDVQPIVCSG